MPERAYAQLVKATHVSESICSCTRVVFGYDFTMAETLPYHYNNEKKEHGLQHISLYNDMWRFIVSRKQLTNKYIPSSEFTFLEGPNSKFKARQRFAYIQNSQSLIHRHIFMGMNTTSPTIPNVVHKEPEPGDQ